MVAKAVIIFGNGTIIVFDTFGERIRECQGCILDVKIIKNLNKYCDEDTKFYRGDWVHKTRKPLDWDFKWWFKKKKKDYKVKSGVERYVNDADSEVVKFNKVCTNLPMKKKFVKMCMNCEDNESYFHMPNYLQRCKQANLREIKDVTIIPSWCPGWRKVE